ncbi:hypothetical protein [Halochromatium roseum]|uniref:hypothetical protein n=1 Tax=Halochromatium roseum TaxID=391920 RepID=UPI0019142EFD|nr:hypothetical protein [Halochromatium roseum]
MKRRPLNVLRNTVRAFVGAGVVMLLLPTAALADQDKTPIPKVGHCPVGYRTSGEYCVPLERTDSGDNDVIIKLKHCPKGYRTSGNYCVKLK